MEKKSESLKEKSISELISARNDMINYFIESEKITPRPNAPDNGATGFAISGVCEVCIKVVSKAFEGKNMVENVFQETKEEENAETYSKVEITSEDERIKAAKMYFAALQLQINDYVTEESFTEIGLKKSGLLNRLPLSVIREIDLERNTDLFSEAVGPEVKASCFATGSVIDTRMTEKDLFSDDNGKTFGRALQDNLDLETIKSKCDCFSDCVEKQIESIEEFANNNPDLFNDEEILTESTTTDYSDENSDNDNDTNSKSSMDEVVQEKDDLFYQNENKHKEKVEDAQKTKGFNDDNDGDEGFTNNNDDKLESEEKQNIEELVEKMPIDELEILDNTKRPGFINTDKNGLVREEERDELRSVMTCLQMCKHKPDCVVTNNSLKTIIDSLMLIEVSEDTEGVRGSVEKSRVAKEEDNQKRTETHSTSYTTSITTINEDDENSDNSEKLEEERTGDGVRKFIFFPKQKSCPIFSLGTSLYENMLFPVINDPNIRLNTPVWATKFCTSLSLRDVISGRIKKEGLCENWEDRQYINETYQPVGKSLVSVHTIAVPFLRVLPMTGIKKCSEMGTFRTYLLPLPSDFTGRNTDSYRDWRSALYTSLSYKACSNIVSRKRTPAEKQDELWNNNFSIWPYEPTNVHQGGIVELPHGASISNGGLYYFKTIPINRTGVHSDHFLQQIATSALSSFKKVRNRLQVLKETHSKLFEINFRSAQSKHEEARGNLITASTETVHELMDIKKCFLETHEKAMLYAHSTLNYEIAISAAERNIGTLLGLLNLNLERFPHLKMMDSTKSPYSLSSFGRGFTSAATDEMVENRHTNNYGGLSDFDVFYKYM